MRNTLVLLTFTSISFVLGMQFGSEPSVTVEEEQRVEIKKKYRVTSSVKNSFKPPRDNSESEKEKQASSRICSEF